MLVRCFKGCNYLSFPTDGRLTPTDDVNIGDTDIQQTTPAEVQKRKFEIIGVAHLTTYDSCIACKSKVETKTDNIGTCSKCGLTQKLANCTQQHVAKLHLKEIGSDSSTPFIVANAFEKAIATIIGSSAPTEEAFLECPPFACTITNNIINAVDPIPSE